MESVLEKILEEIRLPEGSQAEDWLKIFEALEGVVSKMHLLHIHAIDLNQGR